MMISRKETVVIYHSPCLDGFTSAWVAKQALGNTADYIAANYSDSDSTVLPKEVDDSTVYLLDFTYPRDVMDELVRRAKVVIVLDHHKSAQVDLQDLLDYNMIEGEFDMDRSGAMMAWNFFFFDQDPPKFIEYVQDRDLWIKELPNTEEINLAMFSYDYTFANWDMIHSTPIDQLLSDGKAIHRKHMKDIRELAINSRPMTIGGYENIPTVNVNHMHGSDIGALLCKDQPFAAYYSANKAGQLVFGLRSKAGYEHALDVSVIAKAYGGGGHAHASGFRVNDLNEL